MRKIGRNGFKRGYSFETGDYIEHHEILYSFSDFSNCYGSFCHELSKLCIYGDLTVQFVVDAEGVDEFKEFLDELREAGEYLDTEGGSIHLDLYECDNLECIPDDAFKGIKGVKSVILPYYLERIGDRAFCSSSVEEISFNEGYHLEYIGEEAFANSELTYIDRFTNLEEDDQVQEIGKDAFKGCPVGDYIEKTDETENFTSAVSAAQYFFNAFLDDKLEPSVPIKINDPSDSPSLTLGNALRAFSDTSKLFTLDLSESKYKEIPDWTFEYCDCLARIILPEGLEKIGDKAFYRCDNLKEIKIPSTVTTMEGAFGDCKNLKTIDVSENPNFINKDGYILTSDGKTLILCLDGTNNIPDGVERVGEYSCVRNYPINPVFPEGVTIIGEGAFMFADIESITFPKSLKYIREFAFHACDKFKTINFPEDIALEEVEQYAFDLINEDILTEWRDDCTEEDGIRIKFFELEDVEWGPYSRWNSRSGNGYTYTREWDDDREDK